MSTNNHRQDIEAPISLGGFFPSENDDDDCDDDDTFEQINEINEGIFLGNVKLKIRQSAWHMANANKVWPGTFSLANYIADNKEIYESGNIIELGSATGALAIFLKSLPQTFSVLTSDIDDGGEVEENIIFNFKLNGLEPVPHLPHTWGTGWSSEEPFLPSSFKFIIASDILLYVSAYPALVKTIEELFAGGTVVEFLMSWNRRIAETAIFFSMMEAAGYTANNILTSKCLHFYSNILLNFKFVAVSNFHSTSVSGLSLKYRYEFAEFLGWPTSLCLDWSVEGTNTNPPYRIFPTNCISKADAECDKPRPCIKPNGIVYRRCRKSHKFRANYTTVPFTNVTHHFPIDVSSRYYWCASVLLIYSRPCTLARSTSPK
eukprot:gene3758-7460_t